MISHFSFTNKFAAKSLMVAVTIVGYALALSPAQAATISYSDLLDGTNSKTFAGYAEVTSSPRNFEHKTIGGVEGVGIAGGFVPGEIDSSGSEAITVDFLKSQVINFFDLAFLYDTGVFKDFAGEVAAVTENGTQSGFLKVQDGTTAVWSIAGSIVSNLSSAGSTSGGGAWRVENPFGNSAITQLKFTSFPNGGVESADSDYAFVQLDSTAVPEPTTVLGLLAVGALGASSLKKRQSLAKPEVTEAKVQ